MIPYIYVDSRFSRWYACVTIHRIADAVIVTSDVGLVNSTQNNNHIDVALSAMSVINLFTN